MRKNPVLTEFSEGLGRVGLSQDTHEVLKSCLRCIFKCRNLLRIGQRSRCESMLGGPREVMVLKIGMEVTWIVDNQFDVIFLESWSILNGGCSAVCKSSSWAEISWKSRVTLGKWQETAPSCDVSCAGVDGSDSHHPQKTTSPAMVNIAICSHPITVLITGDANLSPRGSPLRPELTNHQTHKHWKCWWNYWKNTSKHPCTRNGLYYSW